MNLDLDRLQALGLSITDVLDELRDRNQDVSGGRLLGSNLEPLTRTVGRFQNADEIKNLSFEVTSFPVSNSQTPNPNRRVYLRDFAEVIDGSERQRIYVLLNGEAAVKVSIGRSSCRCYC